jgi:hypothetical protein
MKRREFITLLGVRACHQSEDCPRARYHHAAVGPRPRRRGDRLSSFCADMLLQMLRTVFGTQLPTFALQRFRQLTEGKAD